MTVILDVEGITFRVPEIVKMNMDVPRQHSCRPEVSSPCGQSLCP